MVLCDEIRQCKKCIDEEVVTSARLDTGEKPYVQYHVEQKWKPNKVRVLFIAESPPPKGYFYNPVEIERPSGLGTEVLKYLRLKSLEEFRDEGCLMLDAIKCRLNKSTNVKTSLRIAKISQNCVNLFLRREIDELKPETIFVLGKTAKEALEQFPEFEELRKHRITDEFDEKLSGYRVVLCVFPGGQTRMYRDRINQSFSRIRKP